MWLLVCFFFGLVECLLGRRGLTVLLSDGAPREFLFWFGECLLEGRGQFFLLSDVYPCVCLLGLVEGMLEMKGRFSFFLMWLIICHFWFGELHARGRECRLPFS